MLLSAPLVKDLSIINAESEISRDHFLITLVHCVILERRVLVGPAPRSVHYSSSYCPQDVTVLLSVDVYQMRVQFVWEGGEIGVAVRAGQHLRTVFCLTAVEFREDLSLDT